MKTLNRTAALTSHQHRKAKGRRNDRTAGRIPAAKRLESHTAARAGRVRRKTPDWWPAFRKSLRPGLERDTQLMPWLIAESICGEAALFLDVELPAYRAGGLSFADGHAELHRWRDDRTMPALVTDNWVNDNYSTPNNPDVIWLQERATRRK